MKGKVTVSGYAAVRGITEDEALIWLSQHGTQVNHVFWEIDGTDPGFHGEYWAGVVTLEDDTGRMTWHMNPKVFMALRKQIAGKVPPLVITVDEHGVKTLEFCGIPIKNTDCVSTEPPKPPEIL